MSRRILLADDSVTIRKVVELTFMEEDYELTAVADGREALEQLGRTSPDLIIADVHMGDVGGFEVCKEAQKQHPQVPVLLLVGTFEPFDPSEVAKHGASAYLKKPFDSQDLLDQVGKLLSTGGDADSPREPEAATVPPAVEEIAETAAPEIVETAMAKEVEPAPVPLESPTEEPDAGSSLSDADVERIAQRVVELLGEKTVQEIAWEVVPDMAEIVIKDRLQELESQVD